jgi:hypothetical protein
MPGAIKPGSPALGVVQISDGDLKGRNRQPVITRSHQASGDFGMLRQLGVFDRKIDEAGGIWTTVCNIKLAQAESRLGIALF